MKIPIQYALTYPERAGSRLPELDLAAVRSLEFYPVDEKRFPLIRLARLALEEEKSLPVALNAANEVAVEAFLDRRIGFSDIVEVVSEVVEEHRLSEAAGLEEVFDVDRETRKQAATLIKRRF
jgi:1-deoxy-D-xylulose-5-phosphate reductoisomerase